MIKFVHQPISIDMVNIEDEVVENKRHGPLLPNSIRAIFCGPSNTGQTTALISLILSENGLNF